MIFMPESPRLLIVKNRQHEASKSLAWLRGAVNLHDIRRELESVIVTFTHMIHHRP